MTYQTITILCPCFAIVVMNLWQIRKNLGQARKLRGRKS